MPRHQPDPARGGGEEAEEHERLVEGVAIRVRALPATRPLGIGAQHVIEHQDVREPHRLDGLRVRRDRARVIADLGLRQHHADLHGHLSSVVIDVLDRGPGGLQRANRRAELLDRDVEPEPPTVRP